MPLPGLLACCGYSCTLPAYCATSSAAGTQKSDVTLSQHRDRRSGGPHAYSCQQNPRLQHVKHGTSCMVDHTCQQYHL